MRIHWISEPTVTPRIPEGAQLSVGPVPDRDVQVLVSGRPSDEALARCTQALVIPYAGLPARTREQLLKRPDLAVYAQHHNAEAVAEMSVALLLAAARCVVPMDRALRSHDWRARYASDPSVELRGKTAVLLGYGAINRRVEPVLHALGLSTEIVDSRTASEKLDSLLQGAAAVMCAVPSTPATKGMLDARRLGLLADQCVVVNVGRADLIEQEPFYEALKHGRIRAGLDVWYRYPKTPDTPTPPGDFPFEALDNVVLSPHRSGHGEHVERARTEHLERTLTALIEGREPTGRVDVERGY